jgi:hypothetical protein
MTEHTHEERIRLKAYEIWLNEGKPEGRDERHWAMARELVGYEDAHRSTLQPSAGSAEPVKSAATFQGGGDRPGVTDVGKSKPARASGKVAGPLTSNGPQSKPRGRPKVA